MNTQLVPLYCVFLRRISVLAAVLSAVAMHRCAVAAPLENYVAAAAKFHTAYIDPYSGQETIVSDFEQGSGKQRALADISWYPGAGMWHDSGPLNAGAILEADPATRVMRADTLNNISFSEMSGYMCTLYRVDAGTSGLSPGDPVGLVFRTRVRGMIFTAAPHPAVIASSHVYRVTDPGRITLDRINEDRAWHHELLGGTGTSFGANVVFYSTNDPVPLGGQPWYTYNPLTGEYVYDSQDRLATVHVGDSLLITDFLWIRTLADAAGQVHNANFWDTFASTASFAPGFEGLQLVPQTLIIPEPASVLLLGCGAGLLLARRKT